MGTWYDDLELEERLDELIREGRVEVVRDKDGRIIKYRMRQDG